MKATDEPVRARLLAVREALRMTQAQFLGPLNKEAAARGVRAYSQSTLSKLEGGGQAVTLDDIAVFAAVDPLKRGKLWLGWGEERSAEKPLATGTLSDQHVQAVRKKRDGGAGGSPERRAAGDRPRRGGRPDPQ